jgi:hypothetical protein
VIGSGRLSLGLGQPETRPCGSDDYDALSRQLLLQSSNYARLISYLEVPATDIFLEDQPLYLVT